jgi:hypothetical protein
VNGAAGRLGPVDRIAVPIATKLHTGSPPELILDRVTLTPTTPSAPTASASWTSRDRAVRYPALNAVIFGGTPTAAIGLLLV